MGHGFGAGRVAEEWCAPPHAACFAHAPTDAVCPALQQQRRNTARHSHPACATRGTRNCAGATGPGAAGRDQAAGFAPGAADESAFVQHVRAAEEDGRELASFTSIPLTDAPAGSARGPAPAAGSSLQPPVWGSRAGTGAPPKKPGFLTALLACTCMVPALPPPLPGGRGQGPRKPRAGPLGWLCPDGWAAEGSAQANKRPLRHVAL
jgi:hypothetical protein